MAETKLKDLNKGKKKIDNTVPGILTNIRAPIWRLQD